MSTTLPPADATGAVERPSRFVCRVGECVQWLLVGDEGDLIACSPHGHASLRDTFAALTRLRSRAQLAVTSVDDDHVWHVSVAGAPGASAAFPAPDRDAAVAAAQDFLAQLPATLVDVVLKRDSTPEKE